MLFNGLACFSKSVDKSLRAAWLHHGGSIARSKPDFWNAQFFFCAGPHDPWLKELRSRRLIVRHAQWISKSVSEQFAVPVSNYILDDQFDPTKISASQSSAEKGSPLVYHKDPPLAAPLKRPIHGLDSRDASRNDIDLDPRPLKRLHTAELQLASSHDDEPLSASTTLVDIQPEPALALKPSSSFSPRPTARLSSFSPRKISESESHPNRDLRYPASKLRPGLASNKSHTNAKSKTNNKVFLPNYIPNIDFTLFNGSFSLATQRARPVRLVDAMNNATTRATNRLSSAAANANPNVNPPQLQPDQSQYLDDAPRAGSYRTSIATLLNSPRPDACVFAVEQTYCDKIFACMKIAEPRSR